MAAPVASPRRLISTLSLRIFDSQSTFGKSGVSLLQWAARKRGRNLQDHQRPPRGLERRGAHRRPNDHYRARYEQPHRAQELLAEKLTRFEVPTGLMLLIMLRATSPTYSAARTATALSYIVSFLQRFIICKHEAEFTLGKHVDADIAQLCVPPLPLFRRPMMSHWQPRPYHCVI